MAKPGLKMVLNWLGWFFKLVLKLALKLALKVVWVVTRMRD